MNTPSPLIPQGTLPSTHGKSHIRIAVITILAVHVVLLLALLMAGCKKTSDSQAKNDLPSDTSPPPFIPDASLGTNPPTAAQVTNIAPAPGPVAGITPVPTPPQPGTPITALTGEGSEHVVMKGDSFYTIAKKYNVPVKAIASANPGVDSTKLKIGQKLHIPASSPTPATPAGYVNGTGAVAAEKVYTVKSGDNLNKIAKLNEVTVKALRTANNLKTDQIKVGQKLKIPTKTSTPEPVTSASAAGGTGTNL